MEMKFYNSIFESNNYKPTYGSFQKDPKQSILPTRMFALLCSVFTGPQPNNFHFQR